MSKADLDDTISKLVDACAAKDAEIERLMKERDGNEKYKVSWESKVELINEAARLREALELCEWSNGKCPVCGRAINEGHNKICRLSAALADSAEPPQEKKAE
jgi:hypothetical protein